MRFLLVLSMKLVLCYCKECNGNCRCHGRIMDCSNVGLKRLFFQEGMPPSQVTTIELKRNNISVLPSKRFAFVNTAVTEVKFDSNKVENVSTRVLGQTFPMLHILSFFKNRIKIIRKRNFVALQKLKFLDLGQNQITAIENESFSRLAVLEKLFIDGNQMKTLLPDTFKGLTSLVVLKLNLNEIPIIDHKWLRHMTSLEQLLLKSNRIRYIQPFDIKWPSSLRILDLSHNQMRYLPNLPSLKNINSINRAGSGWYIDLSGNPVNCNCFMPSLKDYSLHNLVKAVCGINIECQIVGEDLFADTSAYWPFSKNCNASQRISFFANYLRKPACQKPQLRLKAFNLKVSEDSRFTHLQCVADGTLLPDVKIEHLQYKNSTDSFQVAKNIANLYLASDEQVSKFQCVGTNNVASVKSREWMGPKQNCSLEVVQAASPGNKKEACLYGGGGDVFSFTVFSLCMAIALFISLAYVWMICTNNLDHDE